MLSFFILWQKCDLTCPHLKELSHIHEGLNVSYGFDCIKLFVAYEAGIRGKTRASIDKHKQQLPASDFEEEERMLVLLGRVVIESDHSIYCV